MADLIKSQQRTSQSCIKRGVSKTSLSLGKLCRVTPLSYGNEQQLGWLWSFIILTAVPKSLDIFVSIALSMSLRWRHNDHAGVSNHQPPGCLLNRLFRRKSKKTSKLRVTGLCAGNSPGTGEFSAQMASYAENVSIWWRHHVTRSCHSASRLLLNTLWPKQNACQFPDDIFQCIFVNEKT